MNTKTLCLANLSTQDASGYEIKKLSQEGIFSHFVDASFGSIYPALSRMEQEGLVSVREEFQSGKPPSKIYSITELGRDEFATSLSAPIKDDVHKSEFLLIAMFAPIVPRHAVAKALQMQKDYYRRELENIAEHNSGEGDCPDSPGADWVASYGQRVLQNALDYLRENSDRLLEIAGSEMTEQMAEAAE